MADARPGAAGGVVDLQPAPVGSRRVEETLRRMMACFGVLFALLTLPQLAEGWRWAGSPLGLAIAVAVLGLIALTGLAVLLHQWTRGLFLATAVGQLVALVLWPAAVTAPWPPDRLPWVVAVAGVPCGFMVIAGRGLLPVAYLLGVAGLVTGLRASPAGGSLPLVPAAAAGGYVLVLGLAVLLVVAAVRRAARQVDDAQGTALGRYAHARIDEATESERVRTDALVHDSVLTTFLSAAGARTPEHEALAARMAQNALEVLTRATVASHGGPKVAVADLLQRVRRDAAGIGDRFEFQVRDVRDHVLPDPVADAVVSAAVQAMTNSVKHAGGPEVPRRLLIEGMEGGGVRVSVTDRGKGFDPAAVASERLGLRVSILERMRRVGGEVDVRTAPGEGAEFVLSWPAASPSAIPAAGREQAVPA